MIFQCLRTFWFFALLKNLCGFATSTNKLISITFRRQNAVVAYITSSLNLVSTVRRCLRKFAGELPRKKTRRKKRVRRDTPDMPACLADGGGRWPHGVSAESGAGKSGRRACAEPVKSPVGAPPLPRSSPRRRRRRERARVPVYRYTFFSYRGRRTDGKHTHTRGGSVRVISRVRRTYVSLSVSHSLSLTLSLTPSLSFSPSDTHTLTTLTLTLSVSLFSSPHFLVPLPAVQYRPCHLPIYLHTYLRTHAHSRSYVQPDNVTVLSSLLLLYCRSSSVPVPEQ